MGKRSQSNGPFALMVGSLLKSPLRYVLGIGTAGTITAYLCAKYYYTQKYETSILAVNRLLQNERLLSQHNEIWEIMQLSTKTRNELQQTVETVNNNIHRNYTTNPGMMDYFITPKRAFNTTHDDFIDRHLYRFDKLGLTQETQQELSAAASWTFHVLHPSSTKQNDHQYTQDDIKRANKIQQIMVEFDGPPPPCCDDNIFLKAKNYQSP
eukprot:70978_1